MELLSGFVCKKLGTHALCLLHQESSEGNQPVVLTLDPRRERKRAAAAKGQALYL